VIFFPFLRKITIIDFLRRFGIIPLVRQRLVVSAKSFIITKATTLKTLFNIPSSLKAFRFERFLINLLIFFIKILRLISSTLWSIITSIMILLKSIIPVLGKNLATRILAFIILSPIKGSLVDLLRFSK